MSIFARVLQIFFMIAGLTSFLVGLIMILIAKPHWYCEPSRNGSGTSWCYQNDLESLPSYQLFWFLLGLALEVMAVAIAAGARRKAAAVPAPSAPPPPAPLPPGPVPGPVPSVQYPSYPPYPPAQ
ncbi:hypothetical protein [Amycolatopsis jejuensis]|uniref:hypothetical protein n=1 Tax=Amycolatopsis jejuensis TaxID=330084 RepID=UPI00052495B1|nr:hypothetical protein [Amycolatopsis jejuensis]